MNVKLTANSTERKLIVNWSNVDFAKETQSAYGDTYVEVHFGDQYVDVKETLEEIESLTNTRN
tara:strand:- start:1049 stop:1237 length:189 start_codon:yes stop_codon:yes gene_type:complete